MTNLGGAGVRLPLHSGWIAADIHRKFREVAIIGNGFRKRGIRILFNYTNRLNPVGTFLYMES